MCAFLLTWHLKFLGFYFIFYFNDFKTLITIKQTLSEHKNELRIVLLFIENKPHQ